MLKMLRKFRAQSVGEYAIMISIVILAIMGMTYFIQRLFSARINDARGYMMTTLDAEIKNVHAARGGKAYTGVLAEYEPYYQNKISDVEPTFQTNILLNGQTGVYTAQSQTITLMNSISTENPAQDDDFYPGLGTGTMSTYIATSTQ
jgi:uncharacterized protein (UPF0333 family)